VGVNHHVAQRQYGQSVQRVSKGGVLGHAGEFPRILSVNQFRHGAGLLYRSDGGNRTLTQGLATAKNHNGPGK
jgi:hypothetical protein